MGEVLSWSVVTPTAVPGKPGRLQTVLEVPNSLVTGRKSQFAVVAVNPSGESVPPALINATLGPSLTFFLGVFFLVHTQISPARRLGPWRGDCSCSTSA